MGRPTLIQRLAKHNAKFAFLRRSKKAAEEEHKKAVECLRRIIKRENDADRRKSA